MIPDKAADTVTVTVTTDENAVTPEGMTALISCVDHGHTLRVDSSDPARTISIGQRRVIPAKQGQKREPAVPFLPLCSVRITILCLPDLTCARFRGYNMTVIHRR